MSYRPLGAGSALVPLTPRPGDVSPPRLAVLTPDETTGFLGQPPTPSSRPENNLDPVPLPQLPRQIHFGDELEAEGRERLDLGLLLRLEHPF